MFKRTKRKTGSNVPLQDVIPPMPEMNIVVICQYETPCGWCTKWDKKCDKEIGCSANIDDPKTSKPIEDIKSGKGLNKIVNKL